MKEKIKNILKEHKGTFYQTHTFGKEVLVEGIRGIERRDSILVDDIKDKVVLDLGCATGSECLWSLEQGAKKVIGIDSGVEQINTLSKIAKLFKGKLITHNLNLIHNKVELGIEVGTMFCFSITHHIKFRKIWHEIAGVKVVYVEGGADSNYTEESLTDELFIAKFVKHIPNNSINKKEVRPLYR
ncbi:MAG TPA: DUF1698 domain-containing protein [Chromatiaceae bacterium]|nr:DUF1698 domain-containing protein [Chromatiaceae bacterium]